MHRSERPADLPSALGASPLTGGLTSGQRYLLAASRDPATENVTCTASDSATLPATVTSSFAGADLGSVALRTIGVTARFEYAILIAREP